jgi:protein SCO1/2
VPSTLRPLRSVVVALLLVLGSCGQDRTEEGPIVGLSVSAPTIDFPVPEFELVDQRGKKFTRADMVGSVFVVDFVFTSCPKVCPELTKKMAALSKKLRPNQGVKFLSISVDPETDTPERLLAFQQKHGDVEAPWFFVTGDPKVVDETVLKGFKMALSRGTDGGHGDASIFHAERFVVTDKRGHMRGAFETTPAGLERLEAMVAQLTAD